MNKDVFQDRYCRDAVEIGRVADDNLTASMNRGSQLLDGRTQRASKYIKHTVQRVAFQRGEWAAAFGKRGTRSGGAAET